MIEKPDIGTNTPSEGLAQQEGVDLGSSHLT